MDTREMMTCLPSEMFSMERVRYFTRQLITPDDLTLEQEYFQNKMRRHNRFLHGWGVVCGCLVQPVLEANSAWMVRITPGYILGPYGDEILIEREVTIDLHKEGLEGTAACVGQTDPWCSDVVVERQPRVPLYVAVKYAECKTRPMRVQTGCGCDETQCEYSRIRDSYAIKALSECPETHMTPPILDLNQLIQMQMVPNCPPSPTDPWVVLAKVIPGDNGEISSSGIFNCDFENGCYRRMVVSFANFWWRCTEPVYPTPTPTPPPG